MEVLSSTDMVKQFKMYLPEEKVAELDSAADRFHRRSGQQVAEEVINLFLIYWEQAEQAKLNRIEDQRESIIGSIARVPTTKANLNDSKPRTNSLHKDSRRRASQRRAKP